MKVIHGIPEHDYFTICLPGGTVKKMGDENINHLELEHPKMQKPVKAKYVDHWTVKLEEFRAWSSFIILVYGCSWKYLSDRLQAKHPGIKTFEFILLKQL